MSKIKVIFENHKKEEKIVEVDLPENQDFYPTIFEIARQHEISIEGACGGVLACATCHVHVPDPFCSKLPEASVMEESMLDQAQELDPEYSRLCCQIKVQPELDGVRIIIPESSENKSGHVH